MKVVSVNVGQSQDLHWKGQTVRTAIVKRAVDHPVAIRGVNLEGDQQTNLEVHGGPEKAVYGFPSEHYSYWKQQMPALEFPWGSFGENLTTEGLLDNEVFIGDHIRFGSALLAITQPRMPCSKLQARFQNDDVLECFLRSGRHGFYFSIIEEGVIGAGDAIEFVKRDPNRVSITDVITVYYRRSSDRGLEQKVINLEPLGQRFRNRLAERVQA